MHLGADAEPHARLRVPHGRLEQMLERYQQPLERKNVRTLGRLMQLIKLDLEKLTRALFEVRDRTVLELLSTFFPAQPEVGQQIRGALSGPALYHLGFEIYEPLGLVLEGIQHWAARAERGLGRELRVMRVLRFPASGAFERRIGARAEIMRIWLRVDGRSLMLELFDLARPVDACLSGPPPRLTHRSFDCLLSGQTWQERVGLVAEPQSLEQQELNPDEIWHYALLVERAADVYTLHALLDQLCQQDPDFVLAYAEPVANDHDGSLHTKILNLRKGIELELVAQRWSGA